MTERRATGPSANGLHDRAAPPAPVVVSDLGKTYADGTEAVRGISFEVGEGEIFGLLGPNGAGKSTTFGILTTLVRPTAGRALVAGHDVVRDPLAVRRAIGVAFQDSVLDNEFSGKENLRLHARLWGMPRSEAEGRTAALLAAMGLEDRAGDNVRAYSGGMRRRLEIARALLAGPRVLFLDEPTVGLDPAVRNEIWRLVEDLRRQEGVTIVLSTHYLEEAAGVADRVAIMDRGRIVALDAPAELVRALGREVVELQVGGDPDPVALALDGTGLGSGPPLVAGGTVALPTAAEAAEAARRVNDLPLDRLGVVGLTVRRTTLNDVFLHATGRPSGRPLVPIGGAR